MELVKKAIEVYFAQLDTLDDVTLRSVRRMVNAKFPHIDMHAHSDEIKQIVLDECQKVVNRIAGKHSIHKKAKGTGEKDSGRKDLAGGKGTLSCRQAKNTKLDGRRFFYGSKGFNKPLGTSAELRDIIGQEYVSRGQAVKLLWVYIKANDLQDHSDGRFIIPDATLAGVTGTTRFHMTKLPRFLQENLTLLPDDEVDRLVELLPPDHEENAMVKRRAARKERREKKAKEKKKRQSTNPPTTGWAQPLRTTPELAAVLGKDTISRTDLAKEIWVYIKAKGLQDPSNGRTIRPDSLLAEVLGHKPIDMMKMTKELSKHLSPVESQPAARATGKKRPREDGKTHLLEPQ